MRSFITCNLRPKNGKVKDDDMGRAFSTHGEEECIQGFCEEARKK
jgi:hypothetical protein